MQKKFYMQPEMKVVEIDSGDIICTSPDPIPSVQNESYEEGSTADWFNN